jgi:hypothetical protein
MKFNVSQIVRDYLKTLRGEKWSALSLIDFAVVFCLPILAAFGTYWISDVVEQGIYLSLFTLFGVFVAVFMAILGVLVPLYHAPRKSSSDPVVDERYVEEHKFRLKLIQEISAALNYLMLFSLIAMAILMLPISTKSDLFLFKWLSLAFGVHLILNLLIVLKRIHALFHYEFDHES